MSDDEDPIEAFVARTLAQAGTRRDAPREVRNEIQAAVEAAWRQSVGANRRRRLRHRSIAAAAAAVALAAGVFGIRHWPQADHAAAGIFLASRGHVEIDSPGQAALATGGQTLSDGTRISTGADGRVLLTLSNRSLRIGADSILRLRDAGRVELEQGRVYLDSDAAQSNGATPLGIATRFGLIEHLGTQYQVAVSGERMVLAVREGRVRIASASGSRELTVRQRLTLTPDGTALIDTVPTYGEPWNWVSELEPDFPIEGRSLAEFLTWFTRESGISIRYADDPTRAQAQHTAMSGSIAGLSPLEALQGVLTATRFAYRVQGDGSYLIEVRPASHAKLSLDGAESPVASN